MIKAILKPFKFIFKAVKFVVMLPINLVKFILIKVMAVIKYVLNLVWKILKGIYKGIVGVVNEGLLQVSGMQLNGYLLIPGN
jgi:hypothetical protein